MKDSDDPRNGSGNAATAFKLTIKGRDVWTEFDELVGRLYDGGHMPFKPRSVHYGDKVRKATLSALASWPKTAALVEKSMYDDPFMLNALLSLAESVGRLRVTSYVAVLADVTEEERISVTYINEEALFAGVAHIAYYAAAVSAPAALAQADPNPFSLGGGLASVLEMQSLGFALGATPHVEKVQTFYAATGFAGIIVTALTTAGALGEGVDIPRHMAVRAAAQAGALACQRVSTLSQ